MDAEKMHFPLTIVEVQSGNYNSFLQNVSQDKERQGMDGTAGLNADEPQINCVQTRDHQ